MQEGKTGRDIAVGARPVRHRVVTGAVTLDADDEHVIAEIPLAAASDYDITLPPLSARPGQVIYVSCRRASGSYVDGGVQLVDQTDGIKAAGLSNDKLTAATDFWHVENVLGLFWRQIAETTT
jgi:hypothetical protein